MADFTSGKNWSDFYSGILPLAATAQQPDVVDWNQFYSGILPSTPSAPPVSPNLTAAEKQLLQQQLQQSQTLQAGYNPNGTAKIRPSWTIPADAPVMTPNATPASWNSIDQAGYNAAKKPGTWLASSRMNAQALMRQMAQRGTVPATVPRAVAIPSAVVATPNANVTAPIKPQSRGGLLDTDQLGPANSKPVSQGSSAAVEPSDDALAIDHAADGHFDRRALLAERVRFSARRVIERILKNPETGRLPLEFSAAVAQFGAEDGRVFRARADRQASRAGLARQLHARHTFRAEIVFFAVADTGDADGRMDS